MADQNVRDAELAPSRDSWGYISIPNPDNEITDAIISVKESTDAAFEAILLGFELVNAVLDLVASFLVDINNPIALIIEAILSILNSFIEDLRNAGIFVTWDKSLSDLSKLSGGYPAYESRLIKKILNKSDSSRPDFNANTKVLALNFFAGVGLEGIESIYLNVIKPIQDLIKLIKTDYKAELTAPKDTDVAFYKKYGVNVEVDAKLGSEEDLPDGLRLKWKISAAKSTNPNFRKTFLAPNCFLISVSSRNSGDLVGVGISRKREQAEVKSPNDSPIITEPKLIENPSPINARLLPLLANKGQFGFQDLLESGEYKEGELVGVSPTSATEDYGFPLVVFSQDTVHVSKIEDEPLGDVYRLFYFKSEAVGDGDPSFSVDLPFSALKTNGLLKEDYYVTVYACGAERSELILEDVAESPLKRVRGNTEKYTVDIAGKTNLSDLSVASNTKHIDVPTKDKNDYQRALRNFLCWFLLARLNEATGRQKVYGSSDPFNDTLLNRIYASMGVKVSSELSGKLYLRAGLTRETFAERVIQLVEQAIKALPSPPQEFVTGNRQSIQTILNAKYPMYELLEKTAEGGDADGYFKVSLYQGKSIEGILYSVRAYDLETGVVWEELATDFSVPIEPKYISAELYSSSPALRLLRSDTPVQSTVALLPETAEICRAGTVLLNGIPSTEDVEGEWVNYRPFQNTDLSFFLDGLEVFKRYLEAFQNGIEGLISEILRYIRIVQMRIQELRLIILKIQALIDAILNFKLPAGLYATYHITNGTGGLVNAIVNAENKPPISSAGYGAGSMIVAGGLPSILVELFIALIGGEE